MGIEMKLLVNAVLVVLTLLAGIFIHKTGKPYNKLIFTIHKFATIGFVVFSSIILFNHVKISELGIYTSTFIILSVVSILALFVSGALLSLDKFYDRMLLIHRASTFTFIIFFVASIYSIYSTTN
jgi:hypothetical protein